MRDVFDAQVDLLVRVLPIVAKEEVFALKGGTAINLFYRDLPRLSVDIDLTYLPVKGRTESLLEITETLDRIATNVEQSINSARARRHTVGEGGATRIVVSLGSVRIKIETSPVTRGVVHDPDWLQVCDVVEDKFGFAEIQVVSFEDLFAGKLHAAVDRQHPRDLFDVKLLYENEGMTDVLFQTFLVYVASSNRPPHELLDPHLIDLDRAYAREFVGMTTAPIELEELIATRRQLITDIRNRLDENARTFLLSLHDGEPDFSVIGLIHAAELPAVRWKLLNLRQLIISNPDKHAIQRDALDSLFDSA